MEIYMVCPIAYIHTLHRATINKPVSVELVSKLDNLH